MLTRNAEEILQLHEQFVRELRKEIIPLGFHLDAYKRSDDPAKSLALAMQNTDAAIRVISTKFATEVREFFVIYNENYKSVLLGFPFCILPDLLCRTP